MGTEIVTPEVSEPPGRNRHRPYQAIDPFHAPLLSPNLPESCVPSASPPPLKRRPRRPFERESERSHRFRKTFFPHVGSADWSDWKWQMRNRVTNLKALSSFLQLSEEERRAIQNNSGSLGVCITPYYASLLDPEDPTQPLRKTVVPVTKEYARASCESDDPLGEEGASPVPRIVHRYPDRVLFLVTDRCATHCRYCTRSRMVGKSDGKSSNGHGWDQAIAYIESNRSVRDVLISGGDPLTLPDETLGRLLSRLRSIPHVEILRIGTKVPVVLPQRITPALTRMLKRFHPLWINIHFTHPDEITPEVAHACARLADAGIPLGSQTVLLSGINDDLETMKRLLHGLLRNRVRPYYLYQCDPIPGSSHFKTPVRKGLEIIRGLRGHTTGFAVPTYVIDAPGGGGKIPLLPNYLEGRDEEGLILRNYEGRTFTYPDQGPNTGEHALHRRDEEIEEDAHCLHPQPSADRQ
jgi:lysine 2,3-aminomutase